MIDKTTSLAHAIGLIQDDQVVGLGGMTIYRRPVSFIRELILQEKPPKNLTLLSFTCGLESDMLIGSGLISKTRCCYFGLESFGLAPMFTNGVSNGSVTVIEESEASLANGLRAKLAGIGFMPSQAWIGTEMFKVRPDVKTIGDPYTGAPLTAFPAIGCDVAVIHVLKADKFGNSVLGGNPTIDLELATVAEHTIITAEEIVDALPAPIDIPGHTVDMVIHQPQGAWPTSCYPLYPIDGECILEYIAACNNGRFQEFIRWIGEPAGMNFPL